MAKHYEGPYWVRGEEDEQWSDYDRHWGWTDQDSRWRAEDVGRGWYWSEEQGRHVAIADGTTTTDDVATQLAAGTGGQELAARFWVDAANLLNDTAWADLQAVYSEIRRGERRHEEMSPAEREVVQAAENRADAALEAANRAATIAEYGSEAAGEAAELAERRNHAEAEKIYELLFDGDHYATIVGDGQAEDSYIDNIWSAAETNAAMGRTAAGMRAQRSTDDAAFQAAFSDGDVDGDEFTDRSDQECGADRAEVQRVYDYLNNDPDYAGIEGDGTRTDSDGGYEHAESLVALGYTATNLAELDAQARAEARAEAQAEIWGPAAMTEADFRLAGSGVDEATGMTAAQLRGEAPGPQLHRHNAVFDRDQIADRLAERTAAAAGKADDGYTQSPAEQVASQLSADAQDRGDPPPSERWYRWSRAPVAQATANVTDTAHAADADDNDREGRHLYAQMLLEEARAEVEAGIDVGQVTGADQVLADMVDAITENSREHQEDLAGPLHAELVDALDQAWAQLAAGDVPEVDRPAHEARIEKLEAETTQAYPQQYSAADDPYAHALHHGGGAGLPPVPAEYTEHPDAYRSGPASATGSEPAWVHRPAPWGDYAELARLAAELPDDITDDLGRFQATQTISPDPVAWGSVAGDLLDELDQARARLESGDVHDEDRPHLAELVEHLSERAAEAIIAEAGPQSPEGRAAELADLAAWPSDDESAADESVPDELARGGDPTLAAKTAAWMAAEAAATEQWLAAETAGFTPVDSHDRMVERRDRDQQYAVHPANPWNTPAKRDGVGVAPSAAEQEEITRDCERGHYDSYGTADPDPYLGTAVQQPPDEEPPGKARAADAVAAHQAVADTQRLHAQRAEQEPAAHWLAADDHAGTVGDEVDLGSQDEALPPA